MTTERMVLPDGVRRILGEEEEILWQGRPAPFPLMDGRRRGALVRRWIICVIAAVALTAWYLIALSYSTAEFLPGFEAILLVFPGYAALVPLLDRRRLLKDTLYVVTDRRAVQAVGNYDAWGLDRSGLKIRRDGATFLLGAAADLPDRKIYRTAVIPLKGDDSDREVVGLVFYGAEDPDGLDRALRGA